MRLLTFSFLKSFRRNFISRYSSRALSSNVAEPSVSPPELNIEKFIESGEVLEFSPSWPEEDAGLKEQIQREMRVLPGFITVEEQQQLMDELEPYLKKMRYEYDHWDDAIHGFKETERRSWRPHNQAIMKRVQAAGFPQGAGAGEGEEVQDYQHVLDLAPTGYIKPHIDAVRYCGATIAGLSLLSPAVMLFVHSNSPQRAFSALLPPRSLYLMTGSVRYEYTHAVAGGGGGAPSHFRGARVARGRRVAVIARSKPRDIDTE